MRDRCVPRAYALGYHLSPLPGLLNGSFALQAFGAAAAPPLEPTAVRKKSFCVGKIARLKPCPDETSEIKLSHYRSRVFLCLSPSYML